MSVSKKLRQNALVITTAFCLSFCLFLFETDVRKACFLSKTPFLTSKNQRTSSINHQHFHELTKFLINIALKSVNSIMKILSKRNCEKIEKLILNFIPSKIMKY